MRDKLLQRGFYLFPITAGAKKPPLITEWERYSSNDPARIERWAKEFPGCNWGIDCGRSGIAVVDIDNKSQDGFASIAELDLEHPLPSTFSQRTPSGGQQLFFRGSCGNRVRWLPGVDARGKNGYVVAPGCSTVEGANTCAGSYVVEVDAEIAPAPAWLLEKIGKPRERTTTESEPIGEIDLPENVAKAEAFLSQRAPAVEGSGGDQWTWQTALEVRDLGVGPRKCLELLFHWNDRCLPPWTARELELKVHNAYKYAKDRIGNESPAAKQAEAEAAFSAPVEGLPGPAKSDPGVLRPFAALGLHRPARDWLVDGWIPQGPSSITLFSGEGATGKSLLAIQLGSAVAAGMPWFGMETRQTPVLYVSCEDDDDELDRRIFDVRRGESFTADDRPFWATSRVGRDSVLAIGKDGSVRRGPFYATLDEMLGKMPAGPKTVMLDTVADVFAGSENDRAEVNYLLKTIIGSLAMKHDATFILISHPPKVAGSTYSGSTAWHNAVRNRLFLKHPDPKRKNEYRILSNEKANYAAAGGEMTLKWVRGIYVPVDAAEMEGLYETAVLAMVLEAQTSGNPLSLQPQAGRYIGKVKIIDGNGSPIPPDDIRRVTLDLVTHGRIRNVTGEHRGNGLYVVEE